MRLYLCLLTMVCTVAVAEVVDNASLRQQSVFVEGESFSPTNGDWQAGAGWSDDVYTPTSGDAVLGNGGGGTGTASRDVVIPADGRYHVWVRYLSIASYPGSFGLSITQNGQTVFSGEYRANPTNSGWDETWEKLPADLVAGPATLTLSIIKPGVRQRVDCVLLTSVLDYEPDYHDFAPQVFLRFRLDEPPLAAKANCTVYTPRGPRYYQFPGWLTAQGLGPDGDAIAPGQWSPWVELTPFLDTGKRIATVKFAFQSEGKPLPQVRGQYQVTTRPDPAGAVELAEDVDGEISALTIPGDLGQFPEPLRLASQLSREHYERARALGFPALPTTLVPLETYVTGWEDAYRSERILAWEMGGAAAIGLNSFNHVYGRRLEAASQHGVTRGYLSDWFPYQLWQCPTAPGNAEMTDKHFRELAAKMLAEDPEALRRHYRNTLYDEPGSSDLKHLAECPSCLAGFGPYLEQQGLAPTDFGRETWAGLAPIAREAATDPNGRRLHYWSIQYRDWTNAQMVKLASDLCRKHYGDHMLTMVNFTNGPTSGWIGSLAWGPDWFLYGRLGAVTLMWSEDWTSLGPEVSGVTTDLLRAAARPRGLPVGQYIIANHLRTMPMRAWSALMHGAKILHFYCWGPYYSFADGMISDNPETQKVIGGITREIAKVDEYLHPARVQPAKVALLWGKSHEIWQDDAAVGTERRMLYLALQHDHVPVDFVCEDDIASGLLRDYRVLYVAESNLARAAAARISDWVREGGVLHLSAGAALADEYNEPLADINALAGVEVSEVEKPAGDYREHYGIPAQSARGEVQLRASDLWPAAHFPVIGYTERLTAREAQVLASDARGAPLVSLNKVGKGAVLRFAFMPGLGYVKSARIVPTDTITEYDSSQRAVLLTAVRLAQVQSPLTVSEPMVEAQLLHGPRADVVMLANWGYERLPAVRVVVRSSGAVSRVTSSSGAAVRTSWTGRDLTAVVPIDQVEALILRR